MIEIVIAQENDRLRRKNRILKEEREILKTVPGWSPPVRGRNSLCYRCEMKGGGGSLKPHKVVRKRWFSL